MWSTISQTVTRRLLTLHFDPGTSFVILRPSYSQIHKCFISIDANWVCIVFAINGNFTWGHKKSTKLEKKIESFEKFCEFCHSFYMKEEWKLLKVLSRNNFWQVVHNGIIIYFIIQSSIFSYALLPSYDTFTNNWRGKFLRAFSVIHLTLILSGSFWM